MRILIAWDDESQADLLALYLSSGEHETALTPTAEEVVARLDAGAWDVVLLSMTFPTEVAAFRLFERVHQAHPGVPVVVGCRQTEMMQLPRFLKHGLRFYLVRDDRGDFVFLTLACLESAVTAVQAEEARKLA